MRILLTGAQDSIGQRLLSRWANTDQILAITRGDPSRPSTPTRAIDPSDPDALVAFARGCQILVHVADEAHDPSVIQTASAWADATARLLDGAQACGIERVVWIATHASGETLAAAEHVALHHPLPTVLLRPSWLIGPEDPRGGARALIRWAHDPSPILPFTDIRDLTGAIERALVEGRTDGIYNLAAPSQPDLAQMIQTSWGDRPLPSAPDWSPPPDAIWDTSNAIADLGWWTRSTQQSVADCLVSFQSRDD